MLKYAGAIGAILLAAAPMTAVEAATFVFAAPLSGSAENPPVASPGTGFTTVTYDDVANTLRVETIFSDLLGETIQAHIHIAPTFGANGPVATTVPTFPGFPLGVTSGSYDMTFDLTDSDFYNPMFLSDNGGTAASAQAALFAGLQSGNSYFNLHSTEFQSGELRGNLAAVPEPATWAMLILGFLMVGGVLRAQKAGGRVATA